MKIAGFQPLSLIDYPGVVSSIVFTQGCVFRCVYCHNPELIPLDAETLIPQEDVLKRLDVSRKMLEGVVVTGGEPTLQPDLPEFLREIKSRGLLVKLDTNGVHPKLIERILDEKLVDYLAMDLKHLWERYDDVIRIGKDNTIENCKKTFALIQMSGIDHEFRTTVAPSLHSANDLVEMAGYLKPGESYFLQEIRYQKMLDPTLAHGQMDLSAVAERVRRTYPDLKIEVRK